MTRTKSIFRTMIARAGLPALAIIFMGFFAYYAVFGQNGILALKGVTQQLDQRQAAYAAIDKERARMRNRVALLDPHRADPDLVDELIRKDLGVAHPQEVIIPTH